MGVHADARLGHRKTPLHSTPKQPPFYDGKGQPKRDAAGKPCGGGAKRLENRTKRDDFFGMRPIPVFGMAFRHWAKS
jgi:hypothetical protein